VVSTVLRARLTPRPLAFAVRELSGSGAVRRYGLRGSAVSFVIAHHSPDVITLDEIFHQRLYEPPPPVRAIVAERGAGLVAVDVGANIGLFGVWLASRFPFARLDAFEPDPRNASLLRRTVALNGLEDRWLVHEEAAGGSARRVRFAAGHYTISHVAEVDERDTIEVDLTDVLPLVSAADLVKLDAEGSEWEILSDERFAAHPPRALVLEYHPERAPGADTRGAVAGLLARAGLKTAWIFHAPTGVGMAWAWREAGDRRT
jgi:FkbM family methyltransferase